MRRQLKSELDRDMIIGQIKRLDLKKSYSVEITEKRIRRTISQNSLYWLWLTCIEHETGNNRNDLHDYFKEQYLEPINTTLFGETFLRWSTKDLNTVQFKYYLDHIQTFSATELSITLPNPEDKYWDDFYSYYVDKL